jgi:hypothetical protein
MIFGEDDDSCMRQLIACLDIDSARETLEAVGFKIVNDNPRFFAMLRSYDNITESIGIRMDANLHIEIIHALHPDTVLFSGTITSWDEWAAFMKTVALRTAIKLADVKRFQTRSNTLPLIIFIVW